MPGRASPCLQMTGLEGLAALQQLCFRSSTCWSHSRAVADKGLIEHMGSACCTIPCSACHTLM